MDNLLNKVTNRLINFNASLGTNDHQKFDALHLDVEPQKLTLWDTGSVAVKRGLLNDLYDAYVDIRDGLDAAGAVDIPIYADIPFFWDKLPADGGSVGWTNAMDRDNWYTSLHGPLEGTTIMTFSKDSFSGVADATEFERTNSVTANARIGIQAKVGPSEVWTNYTVFIDTLAELDDTYGPDEATDVENLGFWRYSIETFGPVLTTAPIVEVIGVATPAPGIAFPAKPAHLYLVKSSSNHVDWATDAQLRPLGTQHFAYLSFPMPQQAPFNVQRVEEQVDP